MKEILNTAIKIIVYGLSFGIALSVSFSIFYLVVLNLVNLGV